MRTTTTNHRAMFDLIHRHKHGIETAVRAITGLWHIRIVFEGTRAYTKGNVITLPDVDVFAMRNNITDEEVKEAQAYFIALRGYAWQQVACIVESDVNCLQKFRKQAGSFATALASTLDDIRCEHRFADRGQGIEEAMTYTREQWVWPRFARRRAAGKGNILSETLVGLQVMLKHYDTREEHVAWKAMRDEARTFVERNSDALDAIHDTRKMKKEEGTQRITEVVVEMLKTWQREYEAVAPFIARKIREEHKRAVRQKKAEAAVTQTDETVGALDVDDSMEQLLNVELPPLLLVTYGPKLSTHSTERFEGQYVQRIEYVPIEAGDWDKLEPLGPTETRTLVIHPPNPEEERAIDSLMGQIVRALMNLNNEIKQEAEEALEEARVEIARLPTDEQPYLVYTTANDKFTTLNDAPHSQLSKIRDEVSRFYGTVEQRLKILLRTRTKTKWRNMQEEGSQLDPRAISAIAMAKLMPQVQLQPFRRKLPKDELLETEVGLLTDVSGSMRGQKMRLAKQTTLCFAECLDLAKISFAAWTFTSDERHWQHVYEKVSEADRALYGRFGALSIHTVKGFSEPWKSCAVRLPNMGNESQANYDADSVLWAARQLQTRRAKRRVLFVMSDGLPSTSEPDRQVARQQKQLANVVKAVIAQGIEVVGIGICDDSVEMYYPDHVVVQDLEDLPHMVMNKMQFLLLSHRK